MRRRQIMTLAIALTAVLVVGAGSLAAVQRGAAIEEAQSNYDAALSSYRSVQDGATAGYKTSEDAIASARATLDGSAGRVASEEPRTALAAALTAAEARLDSDRTALAKAEVAAASAPASDGSFFDPGAGLAAAAGAVKAATAAVTADEATIADSLAGPEQAVVDAMAAWQSTLYTNHVQAVGWIPELDQCLGSVDISAHYAGVAAIAEHWSCGGKDFPDEAGTVIALTGVHTGIYRVEGIVAMLNSSRNGVGDLPRGHELLYQTCQNGQGATMSFTALTKIG